MSRINRTPASTVCQGIEKPMARPGQKEDEKIAKPAAGEKSFIPKEEKHQQEANNEAQERGVKESTVAERSVIRNPEIIIWGIIRWKVLVGRRFRSFSADFST
jgi:hypothetical protein